jgi:hypothetical protein
LYRLKFVLQDEYVGNQTKTEDGLMLEPSKILDAFQMALSNYGYEDFRKFVLGIEGLDYLGVKKPVHVTDEDHGGDW